MGIWAVNRAEKSLNHQKASEKQDSDKNETQFYSI